MNDQPLESFDAGHLLIPVGGMIQTEANVEQDPRVLLTLGAKEVEGFRGPGTGFLIEGTATFLTSGEPFDLLQARFPWLRAAMDIRVTSVTQTL